MKILDLKISSQFEIKPSWIINRTYRAPSLPETLTALRYSHDIGPLSWIRANHILCSSQITDEVGISAVALGIALGLLDKTKRPWWQKVPVSKDFSNIWSEIEALHLEDSPPTWQHPCIQKMLQTAKIQADAQKLSFVRRDTLHNILHELMKQVAQKDTA